MNEHGQTMMTSVVIATLVFLVILAIYAQVQVSMNMSVFSIGTQNLINLLPVVLIGGVIFVILVSGFQMSQ